MTHDEMKALKPGDLLVARLSGGTERVGVVIECSRSFGFVLAGLWIDGVRRCDSSRIRRLTVAEEIRFNNLLGPARKHETGGLLNTALEIGRTLPVQSLEATLHSLWKVQVALQDAIGETRKARVEIAGGLNSPAMAEVVEAPVSPQPEPAKAPEPENRKKTLPEAMGIDVSPLRFQGKPLYRPLAQCQPSTRARAFRVLGGGWTEQLAPLKISDVIGVPVFFRSLSIQPAGHGLIPGRWEAGLFCHQARHEMPESFVVETAACTPSYETFMRLIVNCYAAAAIDEHLEWCSRVGFRPSETSVGIYNRHRQMWEAFVTFVGSKRKARRIRQMIGRDEF